MSEDQRDQRLSQYVRTIPSMLSKDICDYLEELGGLHSGVGVAVECGCWLGGSTAHLALGLKRAKYAEAIWCYDRWKADAREVQKAGKLGVKLVERQNTQPIFEANVTPIGVPIIAHRGSIQFAAPPEQPIELFLLDAAKRPSAFFGTLARFVPGWIPNHTIVGFMDMFHYKKVSIDRAHSFSHQAYFLTHHLDAFEIIRMFPDDEPVFARYLGGVDALAMKELSDTLRTR